MELGEEGNYIYLSLHCHRQTDSCIKIGSDESHFNVSLIARDKITRQCPQTTTSEEKGEPKRSGFEPRFLCLYPHNVLPLGQTGSPCVVVVVDRFFLRSRADSLRSHVILHV